MNTCKSCGRDFIYHPNIFKTCEQLQMVTKALKQLVHLHMCEQEGLEEGKPTSDMWYKAVNKAEKALNKIKEYN